MFYSKYMRIFTVTTEKTFPTWSKWCQIIESQVTDHWWMFQQQCQWLSNSTCCTQYCNFDIFLKETVKKYFLNYLSILKAISPFPTSFQMQFHSFYLATSWTTLGQVQGPASIYQILINLLLTVLTQRSAGTS